MFFNSNKKWKRISLTGSTLCSKTYSKCHRQLRSLNVFRNQAGEPVRRYDSTLHWRPLAQAAGREEIKHQTTRRRERKWPPVTCKIMSAFTREKNPTESEHSQNHRLKNVAFFYPGNQPLEIAQRLWYHSHHQLKWINYFRIDLNIQDLYGGVHYIMKWWGWEGNLNVTFTLLIGQRPQGKYNEFQ